MGEMAPSSLLFEQMRSFVTLARRLNLSRAVRELGITRQTLRRHIAQLERARGEALFVVEDRRYTLSEAGRHALREAEELLARSSAWLRGASGHQDGLFYISEQHEAGFPYYLQQQPLSKMWESSSGLLPFGMQCWARARGQIEDPAFAPLRPWLMIFRHRADDWICVEVGEKSSFATWYGWRWERSSVGRGIADLPGGTGFADLLSQPFHETRMTEGVRLDHIHTRIRAAEGDELIPISYERLLLGCFFPDGSRAIAALVNRTHDISIRNLPSEVARSMPGHLVMDFTPPD